MRKNIILSIVTAIVLVMAVVSLNSCSKQESNEKIQNQQATDGPEVTAKDKQVYNNIMNFKKKVDYIKENPLYKSGERMTVDSAVWYLDATVNYTYTFAFESFDEFYTDSVFIEIPLTGGEIDMTDLSEAYFELVDKIRNDIYLAVQDESKKLYVSTSLPKVQTDNLLLVKTIAIVGSNKANQSNPTLDEPFEPGDDFMYGDMRGYCNGDSLFHLDAATKLAYFTQYNRQLYIQDEGVLSNGTEWYAYYTGGVVIDLLKAESYGDLFKNPENNFGEYKYLHEAIPADLCLYYDYMNFYYTGLHELVYDIVPDNWNETNGLTFRYIINSGLHEGNYSAPSLIYHLPDITYKQRWLVYKNDEYPHDL